MLCVGPPKSQIKTLRDWVSLAIEIGQVSLSELGRLSAEERQGAAKEAIRQAWPFTSHDAVHIGDAMQGPLRWLFHSRKQWKRSATVAVGRPNVLRWLFDTVASSGRITRWW